MNDMESSNNLKKEDLILYVFCFSLLLFLSIYFWNAQLESSRDILSEYDKVMLEDLKIGPNPMYDNTQSPFLRAQLQVVYKRYSLANRVAITNSYIKYISFLFILFEITVLYLLRCFLNYLLI